MKKRFAAVTAVVSAVVAAVGLFAGASDSAEQPPNCRFLGCEVTVSEYGPSPSTLTMYAEGSVRFEDTDAVTHTVVFANGLCSLSLRPSEFPPACENAFAQYAGTYSYTVDGKFTGTVVTTALPRSVTLTARTHTIQGGTRLTLRGQVHRSNPGSAPPPPVVVLARRNNSQSFEPVATVRTRGSHQTSYGWKLDVRPEAATTYVAEVTTQRLCYYPASRCAHPQGQVWTNAKSHPFTVRIRHGGSK